MRGKGFLSLTIFTRARITPAYAGKSKFLLYIFPHTRDHPRLCGEKLLVSAEMRTAEGSPPPMRGKVVPRLYNTDLNGITPAYAGKRISWSNPWEQSGDHPRLCGEKDRQFLVKWLLIGSPPPMRGKEFLKKYYPSLVRITPAYAGKSIIWKCSF